MGFLKYILLFAFLVEQNFIFSIEASKSPEEIAAILLLSLNNKRVTHKPVRLQDYTEYPEDSDDSSFKYAPSSASSDDYEPKSDETGPIRKRRFTCDECGGTFTRSSNLTRHQRIHAGKRNHKCQFCGKSFIEKHQLLSHLRIEYGEKNHVCSNCGRLFTDRSNCNRHELICKN